MKSLYITSVEPYSGKTAVCLSIGRYLQGRGLKVGYLKPVSTQPWRTPEGVLADEDAVFVHSALGLEGDAAQSSPIIVTSSALREYLQGAPGQDLVKTIELAAQHAGEGQGCSTSGGRRQPARGLCDRSIQFARRRGPRCSRPGGRTLPRRNVPGR